MLPCHWQGRVRAYVLTECSECLLPTVYRTFGSLSLYRTGDGIISSSHRTRAPGTGYGLQLPTPYPVCGLRVNYLLQYRQRVMDHKSQLKTITTCCSWIQRFVSFGICNSRRNASTVFVSKTFQWQYLLVSSLNTTTTRKALVPLTVEPNTTYIVRVILYPIMHL